MKPFSYRPCAGALGVVRRGFPVLVVSLLAALPFPVHAGVPLPRQDTHWIPEFFPPGLDGPVRAMVEYNGDLIVGGEFTASGKVPLNHLGRWDGREWHPLGHGVDHTVVSLHVHDGDLIVGGSFDVAGEDTAYGVARWDGNTWQPMGAGFDGFPMTFVSHDGDLIAAGTFQHEGREATRFRDWDRDYRFVASWDGQEWSPLTGTTDEDLFRRFRALTVYQGELVAGGSFSQQSGWRWSGEPVQAAARWDGSQWVPFGLIGSSPRKNVGIEVFTEFNGLLIAGGTFQEIDGTSANRVIAWNGTNWSPLGDGFNRAVTALTVFDGKLVASGHFTRSGTRNIDHIARWDPQSRSWVPFAAGIDGPAYSILEYAGYLYTGGKFKRAGLSSYRHLARWTGTSWRGVGNQAGGGKRNAVIRNLAAYEGQLFTSEGPLTGLGTTPTESEQYDTHSLHGRAIVAPHYFPRSLGVLNGGLYKHGRLKWENGEWVVLPRPPSYWGGVQEWFKGHLISAGRLPEYHRYPKGIAETYWVSFLDGSEWMPMGYGLQAGGYSVIHALKTYNDQLVAGGEFRLEPRIASDNIAIWDGAEWKGLGIGFNSLVTSLTVYRDDLIAAGYFTEAGGRPASGIARWDGTDWHSMSGGTDGPVHALHVFDDRLYVGGEFRRAGGHEANNVAAWDGTGWNPLGSGVEGQVLTIVDFEGDVYFGGEITASGGMTAHHLARWSPGPSVPSFSRLAAKRTDGGVEIQWDASYLPWDHWGFHVYRVEAGKEPARLNRVVLDDGTAFTILDPSPPAGSVEYTIAGVAYSGRVTDYAVVSVSPSSDLTFSVRLHGPNPFRESSRVGFSLTGEGPVKLTVYDVSGRRIAFLLDRSLPPGEYEADWNGLDDSGRPAASGLYFYRLEAPEGTLIQKLVKL